jgi:hypothetical protein
VEGEANVIVTRDAMVFAAASCVTR